MSGFRKLAPVVLSVCLFLMFNGKVNGYEKGPEFSRVVVEEGSDAILPCSLSTKEDIEFKLFDWKKDGQKEVFMYDAGFHYNNGFSGQDEQFKGRVSHFPDQLKNGIASIKIQNMKAADSGKYTCVFPRLQPSQTFHIELVVGAAPKPHVKTLNATKDWSLLQCDVQGASPKPAVEWKDRAGNILPAEEPQVSHRGGRYDITLLTTVTKTDHYHCVVRQEEIRHQTEAETFVFINGPQTGWIVAAVLGFLLLLLLLVLVVGGVLYVKSAYEITPKKSRRQHENGYEKPTVCDHEQGIGL